MEKLYFESSLATRFFADYFASQKQRSFHRMPHSAQFSFFNTTEWCFPCKRRTFSSNDLAQDYKTLYREVNVSTVFRIFF